MKQLELNQMENLTGGQLSTECAGAIGGAVLSIIGLGLTLATGGLFAIGLAAGSFLWSVGTNTGACHGEI